MASKLWVQSESLGIHEMKKFIYLIEGTRLDGSKFTIFDEKTMYFDVLDAEYMCKKWAKEEPYIKYSPVLYFRSETC